MPPKRLEQLKPAKNYRKVKGKSCWNCAYLPKEPLHGNYSLEVPFRCVRPGEKKIDYSTRMSGIMYVCDGHKREEE